LPAVGQLLNKSLAEQEIAEYLLAQLGWELMSQSRAELPKALNPAEEPKASVKDK
jgi:hypothetical protein